MRSIMPRHPEGILGRYSAHWSRLVDRLRATIARLTAKPNTMPLWRVTITYYVEGEWGERRQYRHVQVRAWSYEEAERIVARIESWGL